MNIEKSFSFPFEDKEWISKLGLGAVIAIVPILNFAWSGYMVELIRNVMRGDAQPLPNWDDIGKKFTDGLMLALAGLVYALPMLLVICLPLSFMIVPAILSGNQDMQGIADAVATTGGVLFACLMCVFAIYGLFLSVVYPVILVLYAREGTLAACFKFRDALDMITRNTSPFLTAWGISLVASLVVGFVSGFAQMVLNFIPCIGQIAAFALALLIVVYTSSIYAHLFGQFGRIAFPEGQIVAAS